MCRGQGRGLADNPQELNTGGRALTARVPGAGCVPTATSVFLAHLSAGSARNPGTVFLL